MSRNLFDLAEDSKEPSGRIIEEIIKQRRAQMLIHSCIYYELNDNLVSDHKWQEWADELDTLQKQYPEKCSIKFFDREFANWTGATGNHLPHRHPWVLRKSMWLLEIAKKQNYK